MTTHPRDKRPSQPVGSIADDYYDLLSQLDAGKRLGMIRRLSVGYYEGWSPSRAELSTLVDFELGRISEAEFFATKHPASAQQGSIESNPIRPLPGPSTQSANSARPAVFYVDCGELASRLRFVATRLRGAGWTVREDVNYRLVFLDYELLPVVPTDLETLVGARTIPFGGAIRCVPDVPAPWSVGDGRSVRHIARSQRISGTRGPWPVADGVRLIKFVISRQPSSGTRPAGGPAGVLMIDVARGHAAWQPVGGGRVGQAAAN
ncbi:MAG: hypothetical protein ABWZ02_13280 [Nakamurella sp.]